jgi:predicted TPR repeat methyltransferase
VSADPVSPEDPLRRAEVALERGDVDSGCAQIRSLVAENLTRKDLILAAVDILIRSGQAVQALLLIEQGFVHHAGSPALFERFATAGSAAEANVRETTAQIAGRLPDNAKLLSRVGCWFMNVGRLEEGMNALARAERLGSDDVTTYVALALGYFRSDRKEQAIAAISKAVRLDPLDPSALHIQASLTGADVKSSSPVFVERLFDTFAETFDKKLVQDLKYRTPQDVVTVLKSVRPDPGAFGRFLDVGCGTGLIAEALAAHYLIEESIGIDLSQKMLDQSRKKGLYQQLLRGDAVDLLYDFEESVDLVACIEVPIYVGDLWPMTGAVAACLKPGGLYVYSIETLATGTYRLLPTQRFAHSIKYVENIAASFGLTPVAGLDTVIRVEMGVPVQGYVGVLVKSDAAS